MLIANNTITDTISGGGINVNSQNTLAGALHEVTIDNNNVGLNGVAGSGPEQSSAIRVEISGAGEMRSLVEDNDIYQWGNGAAVNVDGVDSAIHNFTMRNNIIGAPAAGPNPLRALTVSAGESAGASTAIVRVNIHNNSWDNTYSDGTLTTDARFLVSSNSQFQVQGYVGGATDAAAFAAPSSTL